MSTPTTVSRVLRARVAERPDADYVVCDDARLSYADAERRSRVVARIAGGGRVAQPDRPAVPDRTRLRRGVAGDRARRRDRGADQHVLDADRAA
jgi:acyl-CoA synthetase (AMP-forming)/AMP-acid ligase II